MNFVMILATIHILHQGRRLEAAPTSHRGGCNLPALGQFDQRNDSGCHGCSSNSFEGKTSSNTCAGPVDPSCTVADILEAETIGNECGDRHLNAHKRSAEYSFWCWWVFARDLLGFKSSGQCRRAQQILSLRSNKEADHQHRCLSKDDTSNCSNRWCFALRYRSGEFPR